MHPSLRLPAAALLASLAVVAHAASFDCRTAKTPTEKAICGSPKLSTLDEQLAAEYARALHALSPAGAARLKDSQRGWLRYSTTVCAPPASPGPRDDRASCLEREFGYRLKALAQAGVRLGPYVFNRIDYYASAASDHDSDGAHPGFVTEHVAFPQIDSPATPATTAWNAAQRKDDPGPITLSANPDDVAENDDTDYTLGCVGDRFVSFQFDNSQFEHGAAHGIYDHEVRNLWLVPAMRKMTASDIFATNAHWADKLPALFWKTYKRGAGAAEYLQSMRDAIEASAANPDRWLLTPQGLQISFDADEAGCYACNPGPITVPWSALKPMLATPDLAACQGPPATKR